MINVYDIQIAHPEVFKQITVKDILFVYYRCPQSEHLINLYNNYEEILFTLSGKKAIHVGGKSWELSEDDALLVRRTAYVQEMFDNVDWEVLAFHFNMDFIKSIVKEFNVHFTIDHIPEVPKDMVLKIHPNANIKAQFYALIPLFSGEVRHAENLIERRIRELMMSILVEPKNIHILAYFNYIYSRNKIPIWHVMENNYMYNLPLGEFAKLTHRSMTTFKNDFKKYYKTTPGKWLLEKRLEHAKNLLRSTSKSIGDIAFLSGFENPSHFCRVFKTRFASTPSKYRSGN